MPLYGLVQAEMQRPGILAPRRAACPECDGDMIAKTGRLVTWHWAHRVVNPDCPYAGESEWHLTWKAHGLDGTQEVTVGSRRADVYSPAGFAVEFQHSSLAYLEVGDRERDWKHRLVWIFDAIKAYRQVGQIEILGEALRWWRTPQMIRAAVRPLDWGGCRAFLDLGDGLMWYADYRESIYDDKGASGDLIYGFPVPLEAVVANVLHASDTTALAAMSLRMDMWQPPAPAQAEPAA